MCLSAGFSSNLCMGFTVVDRSAWGQEIINLVLIWIWDSCHQIIISLLAITETNRQRHLIPNPKGVLCCQESVYGREDIFGCEA